MFHSFRKAAVGATALAAAAFGGSTLASAATSSTASTTQNKASLHAPVRIPRHGTTAHEDAERAGTGEAAAKARAAAVRNVGGRTAGAVTSDFTGQGFEVTVTKRDGTKVEVHLDRAYRVAEFGGHGGPPPPFAG